MLIFAKFEVIKSWTGHEMKECTGTTPDASLVRSDPAFGNQDNFIFVRLSVLREYLEKELQVLATFY